MRFLVACTKQFFIAARVKHFISAFLLSKFLLLQCSVIPLWVISQVCEGDRRTHDAERPLSRTSIVPFNSCALCAQDPPGSMLQWHCLGAYQGAPPAGEDWHRAGSGRGFSMEGSWRVSGSIDAVVQVWREYHFIQH